MFDQRASYGSASGCSQFQRWAVVYWGSVHYSEFRQSGWQTLHFLRFSLALVFLFIERSVYQSVGWVIHQALICLSVDWTYKPQSYENGANFISSLFWLSLNENCGLQFCRFSHYPESRYNESCLCKSFLNIIKSVSDPKTHSTKTARENVKDDSGIVSTGSPDFGGFRWNRRVRLRQHDDDGKWSW